MEKFKAGSQVEVLRGTKESYVSWFPAKIVSVDGCKCTVKLELFPTVEGGPVVEKVHKEDIRPSPPPVTKRQSWVDGDITEVYDVHFWRVGKVAKVLPNNRFVIKLFGSIQLKEFHISFLRVRQAWHNNKWVVIGKDDRNRPIGQKCTPFISQNSKNLHCESQGGTRKEACIKQIYRESPFDAFSSVGIGKRYLGSHLKSSSDDAFIESHKKRKATLEMGGCQHATRRQLGQVDDFSFPKPLVGDSCIHKSFEDRTSGFSGIDVKRGNKDLHSMRPFSMTLQVIEENPECSVASCSSNNVPEYNVLKSQKSSRDFLGSSFDDAESSCPSKPGKTYLPSAKDELSDNIHLLELHAYQATMQALHALGPLSWEQESLLTNLRLSLHISNEEHLIQLRHLLSGQVL